MNRAHHWVGLGTAEMTEAQAREWATLEGAAETPLELNLSQVICLTCNERYLEADAHCPGRVPVEATEDPEFGHRWSTLMSLELSAEEAEAWADQESSLEPALRPRSINLICSLCGQTMEDAAPECPERVFWLADVGDGHAGPDAELSASGLIGAIHGIQEIVDQISNIAVTGQ